MTYESENIPLQTPSRMTFKHFLKDVSMLRRVECVVKRHQNDYFIGWTDDQVSALEDHVRQTRTLDAAEASVV